MNLGIKIFTDMCFLRGVRRYLTLLKCKKLLGFNDHFQRRVEIRRTDSWVADWKSIFEPEKICWKYHNRGRYNSWKKLSILQKLPYDMKSWKTKRIWRHRFVTCRWAHPILAKIRNFMLLSGFQLFWGESSPLYWDILFFLRERKRESIYI